MKSTLLTISFFLSFLATFSQIKLDSGLVAYYPFNGDATDASGNGNNPVFNNATLTSDEKGTPNSAYHFNGVDNYMQVPNSPSLNMTNQVSISLKVRPTGFYTGPCYNNMMVMKGPADYIDGNYFLRFSDVINGCTTPSTTNEQFYGTGVVATTPIVQTNQWYSVTSTYDGTTARIYVNCKLINSTVVSFAPFTSIYDLFIGRMNNVQYPYWLNGDLDEVRIYNRELNIEEVNALCTEVLAVTLTNFNTSVLNSKINLNWNVANEDGIKSFTIERSLTGNSDFVPIQTVVSKNIHSYNFIDSRANANQTYYYRLLFHEKTGAISYSEIKIAKIAKNNLSVVYPNPSKGNILVKISGYSGKAEFTLLNSMGQIIMQKSETLIDSNPLPLHFSNKIKGLYWLRVKTTDDQFIEKIVVL